MREKFSEVVSSCRLFTGIPEQGLGEALRYLHARRRDFMKGEIILHIGSEHKAGLILSGEIECAYQDEDFNKFNMNHFTAGELFGEAMSLADVKSSPVQVMAVSECVIIFLDLRVLCEDEGECVYHRRLAGNLLRILSGKNIFLNQKVRLLSAKSLRNKITSCLRILPAHDGVITLPFSKTALAEFLCVNRTALSRELSRMQSEGIISMNGREFVLHT